MRKSDNETLFLLETVKHSDEDPLHEYKDLFQIGHGNFSSVYSAKSIASDNLVAIKKITMDAKQNKNRTGEIERELNILSSLNHPNCIQLHQVFIHQSIIWIVMEHCVGSVYDLITISPAMTEIQISYIAFFTLKAIEYIHDIGFIHRDIKAANILICGDATIKLADFGSSSIKSKAATFVGTPYWMAPEVIRSLDVNDYNSKIDIWSFGITSYELGEKKPPYYHLNAMSALYQISNNPPHQLSHENWSEEYRHFTNSMLKICPEERPTPNELLEFDFVKKKYSPSILIGLLYECAEIVAKNDTAAYRKFKNLLKESVDMSPISTPDTQSSVSLVTDTNSELQFEKVDVYIDPPMVNTNTNTTKISTIKGVPTILIENENYNDGSYMYLKNYQAMHKSNKKYLNLLEQKLEDELSEHIRLHKRHLDSIKNLNDKSLRHLKERHQIELEKLMKQHRMEMHRIKKGDTLSLPLRQKKGFINSLKSFPGRGKRHGKHASILCFSDQFSSYTDTSDTPSPEDTLSAPASIELEQLRASYAEKLRCLEMCYLNEKFEMLLLNRRNLGRTQLEECSNLARIDLHRLENMFKLRKMHIEKLHGIETESQKDHMKKKMNELKKEHLKSLRHIPHQYKLQESIISKNYNMSIKTVQNDYKQLLKDTLANAPKNEHQSIKSRMRFEKITKILEFKTEMEDRISSMISEHKIRLTEAQTKEKQELENTLQAEMKSLANFQHLQLHTLGVEKSVKLDVIIKKYDQMTVDINKSIDDDINEIRHQYDNCIDSSKNNNNIPYDDLITTYRELNISLNSANQSPCEIDQLSLKFQSKSYQQL